MKIHFRTGITLLGLAAIAFSVASSAAQTTGQNTSTASIQHRPVKDKDKGGDPPRVSKPPHPHKDKGGDPLP